jgi:hypothetical protein
MEESNMTDVITWVQNYQREIMTVAFFAMQGICLLVLLVAAHRIAVVRKKMEQAVAQVEHYLQVVMENETVDTEEVKPCEVASVSVQEEENRLISTVLREIFP